MLGDVDVSMVDFSCANVASATNGMSASAMNAYDHSLMFAMPAARECPIPSRASSATTIFKSGENARSHCAGWSSGSRMTTASRLKDWYLLSVARSNGVPSGS